MRYEVGHVTEYSFSKPVLLEPHTLRLRPRCDSWQQLLHFNMLVDPLPAGITECIEIDGTSASRIWFNDLHEKLTIRTEFIVEPLCANPFEFVLEPHSLTLPMAYHGEVESALAPYLDLGTQSREVTEFTQDIVREAKWNTLPFLTLVATRIKETCEPIVRLEGEPWPAELTLRERRGSCRDLTVLFLDSCRAVGLASRFVSGYDLGDPLQKERHMHSWAEVFLPEIGWRGYDPMHGLAVSDRHIALAAGPTPGLAAPTSGTFRGTGATPTMLTDIQIRLAAQTSCQ